MQRVVVLILDGLRRDFVTPAIMPHLCAFRASATWFDRHRSVLPCVTRCVSACFATGCLPARHGLQGNTVVLQEPAGQVLHDTGKPGFLAHRRAVTGRSLDVPTLAERLSDHGGSVIMGNVSPGATYTQDPDHFGFLHHRAGSFGPGGAALADGFGALQPDLAGDAAMVDRLITEVLFGRQPALAQLWTAEPDHLQHEIPLGCPEHLEMLHGADAHAGAVVSAVERMRAAGEDVLLLIGSDHGHQTVSGVVDVAAELGAAVPEAVGGFQVAANGTAALVYVDPARPALIAALGRALRDMPWTDRVVAPDELAEAGQSTANGLAFIVGMRSTDEINSFGVPGMSMVAKANHSKPDRLGFGQHGGLGRWEQSPVLMLQGAGFGAGEVRSDPSSVLDAAPTILRHLGVPQGVMDGRTLQDRG
jgi:arylsulfatase A-like enzyme